MQEAIHQYINHCGLCGARTDPVPDLELILDGHRMLVCYECGDKHGLLDSWVVGEDDGMTF